MDFPVIKHVLLMLLYLSIGVFGEVIDSLENKVVVTGTVNVTFMCSSTEPPDDFGWNTWPIGRPVIFIVYAGDLLQAADFDFRQDHRDVKESRLTVKIASASTAGVYYCVHILMRFAQLIVITDEPTCSYVTKPNEKPPCNMISEMSCTVRYAANESYVVANMTWSAVGSSKSLESSLHPSTSAGITTAVSTLKLTKPEDYKTLSRLRCTTSFNLKEPLPDRFVTNRPNYNKECAPNADACTDEKSGEGPSGKPGNPNTPSRKPSGTTTPSKKPGNLTKSAGKTIGISTPSGEEAKANGEPGDGSGNSAGGWSVGSPQRSIIIQCAVGIAGFFLVDI